MHTAANPYVVPRDILDRYNKSGPRYTSYPTVPEWDASFREDAAFEAIAENGRTRGNTPLSLYVHIPFCKKLCLFCGCNMRVMHKQEPVEQYLDLVEKEIATIAQHVDTKRPVVQLHWGGGTPTFLTPEQIERLFGAIARHFTFAPEAEISLEVHPNVTTVEHLETLRKLGFNRISMGVQDFNPDVQKAINRQQPYELTRDFVAKCRELGFYSVNIDIMYGLPLQTPERFRETLDKVHTIRPDRVALFNYAHLPNMIPHQAVFKPETLPTPEIKLQLMEMAIASFIQSGYRYIGMDHFALPENELSTAQADRSLRRNFMGYTTCSDSDLFSFGMSAISDLDGAYIQNERKLEEYLEAARDRALPVLRGMNLTADDRLRRDVINRLICHCYLEKSEIEKLHDIVFDEYFATELSELPELVGDGLLTMTSDSLTITPRGQILIRNICMIFDAYLRKGENTNRFSKTI